MEEKKPFMPPPPQGLRKEELPPRPPVAPPQPEEQQPQMENIFEEPSQDVEKIEVETMQEPQKESKTKKKTDKIAIINWCGLSVSFVLFAAFVILMFI